MTSTDNIAPVSDTSAAHEHSCNDPTHHHDHPTFFDQNDLLSALAGGKKESPAKRKNKKKQTGTVLAETIPGNRGNENIDDLVNFINSPSTTNEKKEKKKSTN
jgi:hypothetical protein